MDIEVLSISIQSSQVTDGEPNGLGWDGLYKKNVAIHLSRGGRGESRGLRGSHDPYWGKALGLSYGKTSVQLLFFFS